MAKDPVSFRVGEPADAECIAALATQVFLYRAQGYRDLGATSHAFQGHAYENRIHAKALARAA